MRWCYLGRVAYEEALSLQLGLKGRILAGDEAETLLLLEHPAVITLGRSAKGAHVLVTEAERLRRGVALIAASRGGDVTYHGPGQLVGYPVRRVGRSVRAHVAAMAHALVDVLAASRISARWRAEEPGVWTAAGKIAALGVDARDGIAIHGFALNVAVDLSAFAMIVPCGLTAPVTSMQALLAEEGRAAPELERVAREAAIALSLHFGSEPQQLSLSEVKRLAAGWGPRLAGRGASR